MEPKYDVLQFNARVQSMCAILSFPVHFCCSKFKKGPLSSRWHSLFTMLPACLIEPRTDKYTIMLEDDKVQVAASSMQGWRRTMEDAHAIHLLLPNLPGGRHPEDGALFAVFDGHVGNEVAHMCAKLIDKWVTEAHGFSTGSFETALTNAYMKGDRELQRLNPEDPSGSTANTVLLVGHTIYCANAGDSRAVLCRRGHAVPLSTDHKPSCEKEMQRILAAGAFVSPQGRINGQLALSRAFGDFAFKTNATIPAELQAVTVHPDITTTQLSEGDEFIVMACDGIWDAKSNDEVVDFVHKEYDEHGDISVACESLMDACLAKHLGSAGSDNMTVIIVRFKSEFLTQISRSPNPILMVE